MNTKDDSTIITTTNQPRKEEQRYAEEMLHPRWIAIHRDDRNAQTLSVIHKTVREASRGEQSPDFRSIIGDELFASIDEGHGVLFESKLRYLRKSEASEAQWEACLWRRWFLKDSLRVPDGGPSKPFMGQIVQAKMSLSNRAGVLPPLLASVDDRRESGLPVASVPWAPNLLKQKGNHILWYPDYLYAVSQSSLRPRINDFNVNQLPAFRLAQYKYLPGNWIAEIKSENTAPNHLAAEHYSAFISAYLLHERLLLHWIAKNGSIELNNPVEFNDNLAVHCITCCGPVCKIWRMSIRAKKTRSNLEPIRYDMQQLDILDLEEENGGQRLCDWINALNALALTVQFEGIIADLEEIQANESRLSPDAYHNYSWTSKVGFVYKGGSTTEICVAPLDKLRKAYNNGDIKPDGQIGDKVVQGWDEMGRPLEVDITRKGERDPEPGASSTPHSAHSAPSTPSGPSGPSAPSAGNPRMTQFTKADLRRLSSSGVERIARALSDLVNPGEGVGSTKRRHMEYITRAQQELAAGGMQVDIWKSMGLSKGDLNRLRVDTLRTICNSIGIRGLGPNATKRTLVEALE